MDTYTVHDLLHASDKLESLIDAIEFMETDDMNQYLTQLYTFRENLKWITSNKYGFILEKDHLFLE